MQRAIRRNGWCALAVASALGAGCGTSESPPGEVLTVEPGHDLAADGAKADGSDEPRVELKVTLEDDAIDAVRDALHLSLDRAERRWVYFYDTADLTLFEGGVVLRARKVDDGADDSTVKARPLSAEDVSAAWLDEDGFKCEIDRLPDREVSSCSLTREPDRGEIDDVADADRAVRTLFDDDQERFFEERSWATTQESYPPSLDEVLVLGPADVWVWKVTTSALDEALTVELWVLPDGTELCEVSTKTDFDAADSAFEALIDYLTERGIAIGDTQETKTRVALEYFASRAAW